MRCCSLSTATSRGTSWPGLAPASCLERHLNPKRDHRGARPPRGCVTTNGAYRRPFLLPAQARSPAITARDSRMASLDNISIAILLGSLLVLAGILSSLIALRFGAPLLLVFLLVGVLAGDGGPGGIAFSDVRSTYTVGSIALALILFDGGLRLRPRVRATLEVESGTNDPFAVFVVLMLVEILLVGDQSWSQVIASFARDTIFGCAIGWFGGRIIALV